MAAAQYFIRTNLQLLQLENIVAATMVELETLDALRSAPEMYRRLHRIVRLRNWMCDKLPILEGLSVLARNVQSIHDLLVTLQPAVMPNPELYGNEGILATIAQIKYQMGEIKRSKTVIKYRTGGLASQARKIGRFLFDELERVLSGVTPLVDFQARIPGYLIDLNALLNSRMDF